MRRPRLRFDDGPYFRTTNDLAGDLVAVYRVPTGAAHAGHRRPPRRECQVARPANGRSPRRMHVELCLHVALQESPYRSNRRRRRPLHRVVASVLRHLREDFSSSPAAALVKAAMPPKTRRLEDVGASIDEVRRRLALERASRRTTPRSRAASVTHYPESRRVVDRGEAQRLPRLRRSRRGTLRAAPIQVRGRS